MNDMRDLENGFKREPLGVGVGDSLPEPDDREARACLTQATRYAEGMALTERARGRGGEERAWLDMLALLERVAP